MPPSCDPVVMPYRDVTDAWVVTCRCGYSEEFATESEAWAAAAAHQR